ncbi:MAG: carboxypeptidase regulatory-like domain-containing protein, partial [Chitinispirillaceae bacterium]|nr:carboxypeptidase regulatory-like domain-containing protein [Chitinispirillaceae bacterium]
MRITSVMFIVAAYLALSGEPSAQTIDLQGTVVDESLRPVAGASVTLLVNALATTTNDKGLFHFSGELGAVQTDRIFSPSGFVGLRNNRIELGDHTTARIRVVSIRGAVLRDCIIEKKNGIPIDRLLPSTISSQALFIDISTEGATYIVRAIKCGGKWV